MCDDPPHQEKLSLSPARDALSCNINESGSSLSMWHERASTGAQFCRREEISECAAVNSLARKGGSQVGMLFLSLFVSVCECFYFCLSVGVETRLASLVVLFQRFYADNFEFLILVWHILIYFLCTFFKYGCASLSRVFLFVTVLKNRSFVWFFGFVLFLLYFMLVKLVQDNKIYQAFLGSIHVVFRSRVPLATTSNCLLVSP